MKGVLSMSNLKHGVCNVSLGAAVLAMISIGTLAQTTDQSSKTNSSSKSSQSVSKASPQTQLTAGDKSFIKKAAEGGLAEVELGRLAAEKGHSDEVKKFGQRMVDDHSKANDQLTQLASSKGVNVPNDLDAKDKATKDRLSKLSGAQFDRAYMNDMVLDHSKDVAEFRHESRMAKDSDVKNFASQTLPTLEDHLKEARTIAPKKSRGMAKKNAASGYRNSGNPKQ
jgi:putative membrane protein